MSLNKLALNLNANVLSETISSIESFLGLSRMGLNHELRSAANSSRSNKATELKEAANSVGEESEKRKDSGELRVGGRSSP